MVRNHARIFPDDFTANLFAIKICTVYQLICIPAHLIIKSPRPDDVFCHGLRFLCQLINSQLRLSPSKCSLRRPML